MPGLLPLPQPPDVLDGPALKPAKAPTLRPFADAKTTRQAIYDRSLHAARNIEPLTDGNLTLSLHDVDWADPERFTRKQRKEAVLTGGTLARRMRGTWRLADQTGAVLDERKQIVGHVPYLSSMGTFTHRGNEYTVNHQQRLLPGVFARVKDNGDLESHVNVLPGKGVSHRYFLDPERGVFKLRLGQAEMPLLPILNALGASDKDIQAAWGVDLWHSNQKGADSSAVNKLAERLLRRKDLEGADAPLTRQRLVEAVEKMELDPEVTQRTLGKPYRNLNKDVILAATRKLWHLSRGHDDEGNRVEPDDRDHLAFQKVYGPEDLFAERIARDHGGVRRGIFKKIALAKSLARMPSGALTPQIEQVLLGSGLAQNLEEINPAEVLDKQSRITRMGEGGIPSLDSIPHEARDVQSSHMGFIDALRTPESFRAGVDLNVARGARKGDDGRLYAQFRDKSGNLVWKSPQDLADAAYTTPDVMKWDTKRVPVMKGGRITYAPKHEVDYVLPAFEDSFSALGNLVPLKSMVKGQRVAMASRMLTQALPIVGAEAPLVQSGLPGSRGARSFEEEYGHHMGSVEADSPGRVVDVGDGTIKVRYDDGRTDEIELYHHHPLNRKTAVHQTPLVQPGQAFKKGDMLAKSNYTDHRGATALGLNASVGYMPWEGLNFEDAIAVSEDFAKRATSEHMYHHDLEVTDKHKVGKGAYINLFPAKYDRKTLDRMDEHGIIRVGAKVEYGQPLILSAKQREHADNKIHKKRQPGFSDESLVWHHHDPGVVTDVAWSKNGPVVLVKSQSALQVGDKLSGRYGDKGVVAAVIPGHEMPVGPDGRPLEVLLNPLGTITRANPAQHAEAQLGKLAAYRGRPIKVPDFEDEADLTAWVGQQLKQAGLKDVEDVTLPKHGVKASVQTGNRFFMKLHHTSEGKLQGRGGGGYSADETPTKGGPTGSKRISMLDLNALLSHGAVETLRDLNVRGHKNEDWWLRFMSGHTPPDPDVPHTWKKFVAHLQGGGIHVVQDGNRMHFKALTDKDLDTLAGDRELKSGETVRFDRNLSPVAGGLFDKQLTGGHGGTRWSAIALPEPLPNPVMEEPIRRVLGLTQKQLEGTIAGSHTLPGFGTGPKAIKKALGSLNLDRELQRTESEWQHGKGATREAAVRRWGYLKDAKRLGLHPADWMLSRAPVLPPAFRPVTTLGDSKIPLVSDPNYLYKELLEAGKLYHQMRDQVGEGGSGPERLAVYHAFKAVTGLADPIHPKLQEKNVKGILKNIFGSSPKFGAVQRKLLSTTVDNVGRAVITPNPDYDMDTIGIPEDTAFDVYSKFVVRRLRRRGMPIRQALRHVQDRSDLARSILQEEMGERPVYANRAPVLHKFGIMAFRPKLVKGHTLQVSPLIVKGFNADFDGDAMQFHVPTTEKAVNEAYDRMLPSRSLLSPADFKTPVHQPMNEFLGGLHRLTSPRFKHKHKRTFRNKEDALAAIRRNDVPIDTDLTILND